MNLYESIKSKLSEAVPDVYSSDSGSYDGSEKFSPSELSPDEQSWTDKINDKISTAKTTSLIRDNVNTGAELFSLVEKKLSEIDDSYGDWDSDSLSLIDDLTYNFDKNGYTEFDGERIEDIDSLKEIVSDILNDIISNYVSYQENRNYDEERQDDYIGYLEDRS